MVGDKVDTGVRTATYAIGDISWRPRIIGNRVTMILRATRPAISYQLVLKRAA